MIRKFLLGLTLFVVLASLHFAARADDHAPPVFQIDGSQYTQVPFLKRGGTLDHLDVEIAPNGDRGVICTELKYGISCLVVGLDGKVHELGIHPVTKQEKH